MLSDRQRFFLFPNRSCRFESSKDQSITDGLNIDSISILSPPSPLGECAAAVVPERKLDEIVNLLVETVRSARNTIRVAGDDYPAELVKSKLTKLNSKSVHREVESELSCPEKSNPG